MRVIVGRINVSQKPEFLSEAHLELAQKWQQTAQPHVNWARRYDGAKTPEATDLPACLTLIHDSEVALQNRRDQEAAEAKAKEALLREKVAAEALRAQEAEAVTRRFRKQRQAALLASVLAVICLGFALINLRDAKVATAKALEAERNRIDAEIAATRHADEATKAKKLLDEYKSHANLPDFSRQSANAKRVFESAKQGVTGLSLDQIDNPHLPTLVWPRLQTHRQR